MKECPVCGETHTRKSKWCSNKCYQAYYYSTHREQKRIRDKKYLERKKAEREKYYLEHKEKIEAEKERKKQESITNREIKRREYYQKNKEKINANRREWLKNNKEAREKHYQRCKAWARKKWLEDEEYRNRRLEYEKKWRNKNRERINLRTREWRKKNPEKVKLYEMNRRLKKLKEKISKEVKGEE